MKISLQHPSGLQIAFEGEAAEFDRFEKFLTGDISGLVGSIAPPAEPEDRSFDIEDDITDNPVVSGQIDTRALMSHMDSLGAKTDIDRVAVIAQAATDAGLEGVDAKLADKLYDEMGFPKPARWAKTFSNAKAKGLLRSAKYGTWRTTVSGENYAKHGIKPTVARRGKRSSTGGALALPVGQDGEDQ